jgi:hypothetical protein
MAGVAVSGFLRLFEIGEKTRSDAEALIAEH